MQRSNAENVREMTCSGIQYQLYSECRKSILCLNRTNRVKNTSYSAGIYSETIIKGGSIMGIGLLIVGVGIIFMAVSMMKQG